MFLRQKVILGNVFGRDARKAFVRMWLECSGWSCCQPPDKSVNVNVCVDVVRSSPSLKFRRVVIWCCFASVVPLSLAPDAKAKKNIMVKQDGTIVIHGSLWFGGTILSRVSSSRGTRSNVDKAKVILRLTCSLLARQGSFKCPLFYLALFVIKLPSWMKKSFVAR